MIIEDVVCPFCACLCDDIVVSVNKDGMITEVRNACVLGVRKFMCANRFKKGNAEHRAEKPRLRGEEVEYEDAVREAVEILRCADHPLVYGLSNIGYNAQRIALEIARMKSGIIENSESVCHNLFYQAILRRCGVSGGRLYFATLEQIRDKAHLIIYWGSNPVSGHPRHLSKFSLYPVGLYAMKGVQDRELIVIDAVETPLKKIASIFLRVPCGEDWRVAEIMRKIVSGDFKGLKTLAKGLDFATISTIAERMKSASSGVIFIGLGVLSSAPRNCDDAGCDDALKCVDALLSLVETLNEDGVRFFIFPMKGHFNVVGAVTLLMRETGRPFSVDFHNSDADFTPGAALRSLERGDVDAALIIGADPLSSLPRRFASALLKIQTVVIDAFESITSKFATVFIPSAITGVEAEDIAYRMDGLPLKLKKIVECPLPLKSDAEILRDIRDNLRRLHEINP